MTTKRKPSKNTIVRKNQRHYKRGLELAIVLASTALGHIYAAVGVPGVAIGLALFIADIGADRLFAEDRHPDIVG